MPVKIGDGAGWGGGGGSNVGVRERHSYVELQSFQLMYLKQLQKTQPHLMWICQCVARCGGNIQELAFKKRKMFSTHAHKHTDSHTLERTHLDTVSHTSTLTAVSSYFEPRQPHT